MAKSVVGTAGPSVRSAIDRALDLGEIGLQAVGYRAGSLVVDAWAGVLDVDTNESVDGDSLFTIFSTTKALPITAIHLQAERGLLDYEAPLAEYWPEFGGKGKSGITVRQVLTHRSGMPQMPVGSTMETVADWDWVTERLADLEPLFTPGTRSTYHSMNYGWLLGEVVRRTDPTRRSFIDFVREEILIPLGMSDLYLGVPDSALPRVATLYGPQFKLGGEAPLRAAAHPPHIAARPDVYNDAAMRRNVLPATGAIANARSVAPLFAMLANGGELNGRRFLSESRIRSFTELRPDPFTVDEVIGQVAVIGMGGYWLGSYHPGGEAVVGAGGRVICQPGAGGTVGWADLDTGLAAAVCHNRMFVTNPPLSPQEHPFTALGDAIRQEAT